MVPCNVVADSVVDPRVETKRRTDAIRLLEQELAKYKDVQLYKYYGLATMHLTVDSSVIMAVLLDEPPKELLIELTKGADLQAPPSITWEIGNAFSSLLRRDKVTLSQALKALAVYDEIPIRLAEIDLPTALSLAAGHSIYAYDAYVIECARKYRTPLLSMDRGQCQVAQAEGIDVVEVPS